jgi:uncharacterized membrane protein
MIGGMKKCFVAGLVTLLPLAVTIWIVVFIVHFLTRPFMGIMTSLIKKLPPFGIFATERGIRTVSEILILIGLFLFTFLLGFVARRFFFHSLIKFGDKLLYRIPLVNKVYKTAKEIIQALFASKGQSFKQVVLAPFPYQGAYCVGLISHDAPRTCNTSVEKEMISVFLPTTPNPTTGFLIMCPKDELIFLEMKSDEAIKYVVSCAVIQPEKIK